LVGVLNDVRFFAFDVSNVSAVSLWVDRRILVSARVTALRSVDRLRASVRAGEIFRSPAELLAHLLRDQADVLVQIVRDATKDVDVIEDKLIVDQEAFSRTKLGSLRRVLVRLRRLLAPEPAALFRLLNRPPTWISPDDLRDLRQSAEELSVAVADAAALAERIRLIQEEMVALINEQTNRTLFVLTVVTVLALPLTIIPGLFGMNIGGIPFREHDAGFWIVVVLLAVFVSLGGALVFRARRNS
jgi:zinc transporter